MSQEDPSRMESGQRPEIDALPERLRLLNGFPRTARFLAADPDKSLIILRRFDEVAIRDLLFLEGRVAALEGAQKQLDNENFEKYKDNTAVTLAAQSWEHFALMGSSDSDRSEIPESVLNLWCANRAKLMQREVDKQKGWNEEDRDPEYEEMEQALRLYQSIQKQIRKCDQELRDLQHTRIEDTSSSPAEKTTPKDPGSNSGINIPGIPGTRAKLERRRKDLMMDQKLALGYREEGLHAVQCRWETAKALQAALKDYQEAVHRYQGMLKLEEPAVRSYETLRDWLRGNRPTKRGTQDPSPQFLFGSSMSRAYDQDNGVEGEKQATINDRVSIGKPAARDHWSRYLSGLKFILKRGRDPKFDYPEIDYTPEKYIDKWVTYSILVFAAILVVGAIWFLWLVQTKQPHPSAQLALLTVFIILFGSMLNFTTTASRDQVLAATAAYTAVLVVFVGSSFKKADGS